MIRSILASALLFASASLASAEYVIIIANVGTGNELNAQAGPGVGGPGGARGAPAGGGLGNRGIAPGGPGAGGGFGNQGGLRPGMMGGPNGMAGGMRGMRGMGGPGGMAQATDIDDIPDFIIAVVEVNPILPRLDIHKKLTDERVPDVMRSVRVKHHWGASTLLAKTDFAETIVLTRDSDRKPVPSVRDQFKKKFEETFKSKPPVSEILELADWTLTHGLVDEFPQVMDKLVEIDKSNPAAVAYLKVKADIDRPVKTDESSAWRGKLLKDYKVTDGPHYTIVHRHSSSTPTIAPHMKLLENSMRGFYYWFALKGVAQPVPDHRQVVVVTDQPKDFQHLQEILTSGPVVVDGFFAPRENLAVMTTQRQDDTYASLKNFWKRWEDRNFHAAKLLSTDPALYKESHPPNSATKEQIHVAQMVALMLKALEQEGQRATISHDASRQLLFASGLLPRNVAAPEWLLFGMGSFFETPLWSPWSSFAAPNAYYLPRWKELKGKGLETKPGDTLRKVVSDAYFRALPPEGKADSVERHAYDAALRKARTTSWSLTYFLAKQKFDGLQRYFKEVSKMPRDLELDDEVLLGCFTRAFGLDDAGLIALEREWFSYLGNVKFASESTMRKIQTIFKDKLAQMQQAQNDGNGGQPQIDPRTGQPIQPGGNPQRPGGFGPGGNPQRPGGFGPGGNPQQPGNPGFRPQGGGVPQQGRNPRRPR